MNSWSTCMAFGAALLAVVGCGPTNPSSASVTRALPEVSMDAALNAFQQVCVSSQPDFSRADVLKATLANPNAYIFTISQLSNGAPLCGMRARLPAGQDAFQELRGRYGNARGRGLITSFSGYPAGTLLYLGGIKNGAGEGTFQIGLAPGASL